jgi:hypothetical protein
MTEEATTSFTRSDGGAYRVVPEDMGSDEVPGGRGSLVPSRRRAQR